MDWRSMRVLSETAHSRTLFFDPEEPSLEEQERLAAENAAALEDPNYIDPWDHLLDLDPDKVWPWIEVPDV